MSQTKAKKDVCPICKARILHIGSRHIPEVISCPKCHCEFFSKVYLEEKEAKDA